MRLDPPRLAELRRALILDSGPERAYDDITRVLATILYAAARLKVHGETVGTLCAYDIRPRQLSGEQLDLVRTLASAAVELIERRSALLEQTPATG